MCSLEGFQVHELAGSPRGIILILWERERIIRCYSMTMTKEHEDGSSDGI